MNLMDLEFTRKHHDMLEIGTDLVFAAQVEQEGEGVDICCPAKKHSNLLGHQSRADSENNCSTSMTENDRQN